MNSIKRSAVSKYYPVPLHMHSIWERNASMEGHFYNAQKLGIQHMYITDHDVRMGPRKNHIKCFDFSKGQLCIQEPSQDPLRPRWHGFVPLREDEGTSFSVSDSCLHMEATASAEDWTTASLLFDSSQKRHEYALLANVMLHLNMQVSAVGDDARVIVDVELSQRPPEFRHAHILYVFGNTEGLSSPHVTVIPMQAGGDFSAFSFRLLEDAASVGGGDNVLRTVRFTVSARKGKTVRMLLRQLSFSWDIAFDAGRIAQQKLADALGKKYGVVPFVTTEITGAGPHKICFNTAVPIIDYPAKNFNVSDEEAMEHVRAYGGIYARNHPFDALKDRLRLGISSEELEVLIQQHIALFIEKRAWGAAMMEVGFPGGREGFGLELHLRLWDALSQAGVFITGYGDSDNHTNNSSWFDGNNFVGYIAAEEACEAAFVQSMLKGDLYSGDPVYMQKIDVSFGGSNGQKMGQISASDAPIDAILTLKNVPEDCRVVWTVNGVNVKTEKCTGHYKGVMPLPRKKSVNFVRAALYKNERCIMLTNPIYRTTDESMIKIIPLERKFERV